MWMPECRRGIFFIDSLVKFPILTMSVSNIILEGYLYIESALQLIPKNEKCTSGKIT